MVNSKSEDVVDDGKIQDSDYVDQTSDEVFEEPSGSGGLSCGPVRSSNSGHDIGLAERLRNFFTDQGEGDLLLQEHDRENSLLQWLQALDLQVMGACRADERLTPMLKLNMSSGIADGRLLAHLSEHFEASEVGILARCLFIPLVSIRVGKVIKQGTLLCPTAIRGRLNLALLPTSELRVSFDGDDGCTERLATLSCYSQSSDIAIEEIPADRSGRSFLIMLQGGQTSYFWCSEKSKFLGVELLAKMKDLLRKKPSLAQLTGISASRLECFATHIRAYLLGSSVSCTQTQQVVLPISQLDTATDASELSSNTQATSLLSKISRSRHNGCQAGKASLYQGSLSPRSSSFKEGVPRNLSSTRSGVREKLRRRGDCHLSAVDCLPVTLESLTEACGTSHSEDDKCSDGGGTCSLSPLGFLESIGKSVSSSQSSLSYQFPLQGSSMSPSILSPYYCWCPPCTSTLQYAAMPPQLPTSSTESPLLPPLSSLLSSVKSSNSMISTKPPLSLADIPALEFPPYLPDPLVRIPLTRPSSQQIPTFTPLMCDPIVHIPVIDVCSSGQGYLVSGGPAISTSIPSLHASLVNPLITDTDSMVEKSARETLRFLIDSSQTSPQLMEVLPAVLTSTKEKRGIFASGSRGLYGRDVDSIVNGIAAMGLVSVPEMGAGDNSQKICCSHSDAEKQMDGCEGKDGTSRYAYEKVDSTFPNSRVDSGEADF